LFVVLLTKKSCPLKNKVTPEGFAPDPSNAEEELYMVLNRCSPDNFDRRRANKHWIATQPWGNLSCQPTLALMPPMNGSIN
jgi:hypothetical protein